MAIQLFIGGINTLDGDGDIKYEPVLASRGVGDGAGDIVEPTLEVSSAKMLHFEDGR